MAGGIFIRDCELEGEDIYDRLKVVELGSCG